jgi:CRP-like cAMP-binding protein
VDTISKQACAFNNVSNYGPEGSSGNIDPLVAGSTVKSTAPVQPPEKSERVLPALEVTPPVYIFGSLTEEQRQKVINLGHTEVYEANTIVYKQGDEARKLYLLEEGEVAVHYELPSGTCIPITVVRSGGAFGWSALIRPHQVTATPVALSKIRVRAIERDALLKLMRKDLKIGLLIMQDVAEIIASRLRNLEAEVAGLTQGC